MYEKSPKIDELSLFYKSVRKSQAISIPNIPNLTTTYGHLTATYDHLTPT